MTATVGVVMRNHNAFKLTSECLESLLDTGYKGLRFYVIDDGSHDGSGQLISERFPSVEVIRSDRYIEYCRALNIGIRRGLKDGADYIFVINNDTKNFSKNYFDVILEEFQSDEKVGLVGSLVYDYEGGRRSAGTPDKRLGVFVDTPTEGYVFSRQVLEHVGLFDEQLVRYFEDFDYLIRMRAAGFKSVCASSVSFDHLGGGTSKKQWWTPNFYRVRNLIWFLRRRCKEKPISWKLRNFRGFLKKHIVLMLTLARDLKFARLALVGLAVGCGLIAGIVTRWDNENFE